MLLLGGEGRKEERERERHREKRGGEEKKINSICNQHSSS